MQINHPELTTPALQLIKQHTPNTYEAMQNAHWPVTAVTSEQDLAPISKRIEDDELDYLAWAIQHGLGCTLGMITDETPQELIENDQTPDVLRTTTWLNIPGIARQAYHGDVDPGKLLADVMVHEWTHRRGYGEEKAYTAGTDFALKIGEPDIARMSEHTRRNMRREKALKERQEAAMREMARRFGLAA
jgi:hypothetical protein